TKSELIQSLENDNNELSFYDNSYVALSPDQKFQAVMDIAFSGTVKTIEDLEALMDVPVPFLHGDVVNHETGEPYTYWEYMNRLYMKYEGAEMYLMELWNNIQTNNLLGVSE